MKRLNLTRPDDWHVHLRDGIFLKNTVPATANSFQRALVMPNLKPALTGVDSIIKYKSRIEKFIPSNSTFTPYFTLYLNETINPYEMEKAKEHSFILGGKLYPAGATTHSEEGFKSIKKMYPLFEVMQKNNLVLQIHGEETQGDIFDREAQFIKESLAPLLKDFPKLRIVLEHISSAYAVNFILETPDNIAATITPHHLAYNRNDLLASGVKPHFYCLPILKRKSDQIALQKAAISGNPKFFAGTDSAPHAVSKKESTCGCAGIFSAPYAIAYYTEIFESLNALNRLNPFLSQFGAQFYQMPTSKEEIILLKESTNIPPKLNFGNTFVIPMGAGGTISWRMHGSTQ